jgi:hypothetical protein
MISAARVLDTLGTEGVTDIASLPDNASAALLDLAARQGRVRLHTVTREGEAFALAAGLWIGGRRPAIVIQNTGLLESGDALRGTVVRMRVPMVCLVTYRGYSKMIERLGGVPDAPSVELLSRTDVDGAALLTEPTLRAWGVPFDYLHDDTHLPRLTDALRQSEQQERPLAVLVTSDLTS